MKDAKHIGCMCALAVALGVGMAVANTPAVALAAPADSDKGSSSDTPSAKRASSAMSDAPGRHGRPLKSPGETSGSASTTAALTRSASTSSTARSGTRGTDAWRRGGPTSRPGSGSTLAKTNPSLDFNRPVVKAGSSFASTTQSAAATPASAVITPTPADHPVSRIVSTLINVVMSPFANSAPTAPVQSPADFTLLAFARREFEHAFVGPSTTVNPQAGQITSSAVDPDFISSTHGFFGLFSITSAADPDDNNYVAFVLRTPFFTNVLTSGTDSEDNLGFGPASTGVAGQTVNTFMSPFFNFTVAIPIEDPFAPLFTELVRLGF